MKLGKKKTYLIIKIKEVIKGRKKGAKVKSHPHWYQLPL